jgi:4-amino-4-deoxy-L-arabinose transferase-like glycosyltransferase
LERPALMRIMIHLQRLWENAIKSIRSFFYLSAKVWLVAGFILVAAGQIIMRGERVFAFPDPVSRVADGLNKSLYLSLNIPANTLFGLFLIFLGLMICTFLFAFQKLSGDGLAQYINIRHWLPFRTHIAWIVFAAALYVFAMGGIVIRPRSDLPFWMWLLSIFVFTLILWRNENREEKAANSRLTHIDGIGILVLFGLAIGVGAYRLNDFPAGWIPDEGPFWDMARSLALGEKNPSFFDAGVFTFPVSSSLFQSWIMRWVGVNFWGWRFASVVPAALTIIPLYLLAYELFDRRVAVAANVIMIVNPYFLAFARLGYNNSQVLFPVTLAVYFLVLSLRNNSRLYLWLAGLTAGLGFYTYFAAWLGLVVLCIVLASLPMLYRLKLRVILVPLLIIIAGALTVFLPRVVFGISDDSTVALHYKIWETGPINTFYGNFVFGSERIAQAKNFVVSDVELFYDPQLYSILFARGVVRTAAVLFDPIGYKDHPIFFGLLGPGSALFFVLGAGIALANFRDLKYFIPFAWFAAGFFFLGVIASIPPRPTHMVAVIPVLSLLSAVGLTSLINSLINRVSTRIKTFVTAVVLSVIAVMGLFHFFFMIPYLYSPPTQDDYISWLGRQIPEPANLILVDHFAVTRHPMDESLMKLTEHTVVSLSNTDLQADPERVRSWKNFVVFFALPDARKNAEWLNNQVPGSSLLEAYGPGRIFRGYVVTDLQYLNTTMEMGLAHGITGLWNSPARAILILCMIGVLVILVNRWQQTRLASKL